jgi:hypothetical protein
MRVLFYLILVLFNAQFLRAQKELSSVDMIASNWDVPSDAVFEDFDNRQTLHLKKGRAMIKDQVFSNGILEVDVYAKSGRSFGGITFRAAEENMEEVYLRIHKSNQVDALQYTPVFNEESNWQLYHQYQAKVAFDKEGWNKLRLEVFDNKLEVFVNGNKVLEVPHLKTDLQEGKIGLWALFGCRFSNFKVHHNTNLSNFVSEKSALAAESIISEWSITKAFPLTSKDLNSKHFEKLEYQKVKTESSGLLAISRFVKKSSAGNFEQNDEQYIVARTVIETTEEESSVFSFDYSDKIIVYLNGRLIFKGNNAFRLKGNQYMGHLNIDTNQLILPLEKGVNTIHCVVVDRANGWGLMGKIESY